MAAYGERRYVEVGVKLHGGAEVKGVPLYEMGFEVCGVLRMFPFLIKRVSNQTI